MGRFNDFVVRKLSERRFNPEDVDFDQVEAEVVGTLDAWGVPFDKPRRTEYHDQLLYDPRGNPFQGQNKPFIDRVDVSLKQQFSRDDLKLTLMEEYLHKSQYDFFLGHPSEDFNEVAAILESNFEEYSDTVESEIKSGIFSSPRERTIETNQDMMIAALPEIGIEYDEIVEDASRGLYNPTRSSALRKEIKQNVDENREDLEEVAQPLAHRFEAYKDIYHIAPVAEAFADVVDSHLNKKIGSKMEKWHKRQRSKDYQLGTNPDLYETLVGEYQEHDGSRSGKIGHVLSLMPQYLEQQYREGEQQDNMTLVELEEI